MERASFDTSDGDEVQIDAEDVVGLAAGEEPGTTAIELDDGTEVVVIGTQLEVAAELGLDPLEYLGPDDEEDEGDDDLEDDVEQ